MTNPTNGQQRSTVSGISECSYHQIPPLMVKFTKDKILILPF